MDRITRKNVEGVFKLFVEAMGGHVAKNYKDVDGYQLDYNSVYGGYVITQIYNSHGAEADPFGLERRSTSEMYYTLRFALNAILQLKAGKEVVYP